MSIRTKQENELLKLIHDAAVTEFGKNHNFEQLKQYEEFRREVPISSYNNITDQITRLKKGAKDLLWPGAVNKFAVSAGTSGAGKHLPLTNKRLDADQQFMRNVVQSYLKQRPNIFNLWGKHLSLPGNNEQKGDMEIGEISSFTARKTPWWLSAFQLISVDELIGLSFDKKIDYAVQKSINSDLRVITAAPSWILTIFQRVLEQTGAQDIRQVWPNLQLLVCGGVKLAHYHNQLQLLIGDTDVDFIETYGASEGYFAFTDDLQRSDMKLVIDNNIFYEFIPNPLPDEDSAFIQKAVPLWQVEIDTPYAMLVTTSAGLWRYPLNDIIRFTQTNPPRIQVMGRVSSILDDYGEAIHAYELDRALQQASSHLNIEAGTFTVGSLLVDAQSIPKHQWFVQVKGNNASKRLTQLAKHIDKKLQSMNRHYAIRRESDALDMPEVHQISQQQINQWLKQNGKLNAQGKLPSILDNKEDINFFQEIVSSKDML
ncbi:GH3 auxin-responsive promoter [Fodinibius salinus]|uniref:GH3 auxin-responsive promoter n=1 Tax=Fodinibius salinus TaxID=860790 RepID=A0A5D3YNP8_9BACT|nr:GH3 auxin-responsive promoter family protein [Fodinibius salinus]TYP94978.1 GH3 auxin-responsive promoter [Fodinibius salinus]